MPAPPTSFPEPGERFQGRYQIERLIGSGGFSRVYLATQTDLGRKVALKIMSPTNRKLNADGEKGSQDSGSGGNNLAERFLLEARMVAQLRGPYTVTVHDHGRTDDGMLFMVLEYIDGMPLNTIVREHGALEPRRVSKILRQSLESLQEAHAHGLLHRDIKPANIMLYEHLGKRDNVKVLDFGIAKLVGERVNTSEHEDLTQSGSLLGTPRYMSPEQLRGQELTAATDIYSLGLVAYEMLIGKKAIETHSSVLIIGAQLDPRPFAVPNRPNIPPRLRMIVNRMLSKELINRYANADEVLRDLDQMDTVVDSQNFNIIDHVPDISDSIEILRIEEIDDHVTQNEPAAAWRSMLPALVGMTLVVVVLGVMLVYKNTQKVDDTVVPPADATPLPVETPPVKPAEIAVVVPKKPVEVPQKAVVKQILFETIPPAAELYVNGKSIGKSPVTIPSADVKFPAKIRAVASGGGERLTMLDTPVARLEIDLQMFAEKPPTKGTTKTTKKTQTRKDPKTVTTKRVEVVEPKKEEKKTTLTLPPLDY